jgi:VWFA-related protein
MSKPLAAFMVVSFACLADSQTTFRSDARVVAVYATVRDRDGRLAPGLTADDFEIRDNGRPVDITQFSNDPQPLTVALLLDMSGSMAGRYRSVREATLKFVDALEPPDRVRIGTFGSEVALSPLLTGNKDELARIVREEVWPGGGTPLWAAMEQGMLSLAGEGGRRVVVALTDGHDMSSGWNVGAGDVRRRAVEEDFMIYAIGFLPVGLNYDAVALARDTGGGHVTLEEHADLAATFAALAHELRHQYLLGFQPRVRDGRMHRIEVRLKRDGMAARARRSYLAPGNR